MLKINYLNGNEPVILSKKETDDLLNTMECKNEIEFIQFESVLFKEVVFEIV